MKMLPVLVIALFTMISISCGSSSSNKNKIVEKDISIPFMTHSGNTHLSCGVLMDSLGTGNDTGYIKDFRLYLHDVKLVSEDGEKFPVQLDKNDWQTENVTLLSFSNKENCPDNSGQKLETNNAVIGSYEAPANAVITGLSFKVGVPFELNHEDPTKAESPLNILSMTWNWQGGYKHMRLEASVNSNDFLFHLGSIGCDGDPLAGGTTQCNRNNRPKIELENYDIDMSAIKIDFKKLVQDLDLSAGGACHSNAGQAAICQPLFDRIGLDFYDASDNTLNQANEGQDVFMAVLNHM